ncbi:glutathione S-transferase [Pseudorhodoplanes sp.]|uniref:glutathione S-transferase family protein n=1 Tax=Pseudorhodoplanes sp. TaxID=1934341 RepID=UPI002CF12198|nr:glutathione S-transferase [Pseudorhodoplanes sp.]HWV42264.1 glutathione S-transferase [Pseudorhodoplanes sp.]
MRLYDGGRAPNPRRVRIFLSEKGISVPVVAVDLGAMEHRSDSYAAINPLRRVPALELDDGTIITESIAICRYFEAIQPEPALFGTDPVEIATIEMWQRRIELHLLAGIQHVFRHLHPGMKEHEVPQVAAWGEANKPRVLEFLAILDQTLADRRFAAGDKYSVADITGVVALDFVRAAKLEVPAEFAHVGRWHAELRARPSAQA